MSTRSKAMLKKSMAAVARNLAKIESDTKRATEEALLKEGKDLSLESKKICPVDKSVLINSLKVRLKKDTSEPEVEVGYGANYAFWVHEMPEGTNFKKAGATRKFLERPFDAMRGGYARRIAAYIDFMLDKIRYK